MNIDNNDNIRVQKKQGGVFSSGGVGSELNFRDGFDDSCAKKVVINFLITTSRW